MPKNVMKLIKPSPHRARNDFDLSHRHVFSANFGELLPSTCIETVPGDHIEISVADLIRAIPMVTSPFLRAKQHTDLWFVPYRDLWHNFESFITQKEQPVSSALQKASYLPNIGIDILYSAVAGTAYTDIHGRYLSIGSHKLLNLLGYAYTGYASSTNPHKVNPFRIAAYNYIWYNEYRQQYFDDGTRLLYNNTYSPALLFNFDDLTCAGVSDSQLGSRTYSSDTLRAMLQMRYRCWKKDLYTGVMPATQFGSVSTFSPPSGNIYANIGTVAQNTPLTVTRTSTGFLSASDGNDSASPYIKASSLSVDVLALRKSEAVQIWRENALRAGNRVSDNMNAHYGIESDFRDHRPTYIGSVDAPLNIGDVMTTANSDYSGNTNPNTNVGDVAGKGMSSLDGSKRFKFDAKDFGVIMAITSILPEAEYNAYGISRPNQLIESEDFFIPEYENLGLEPVSSATFVNTPSTVAKVVGYAPRYWGYKTKLDKCYGEFMGSGMFSPWCSPKKDVATAMGTPSGLVPLNTLYVNPQLYDVNFALGLNNSDQFLVDMYFDVDAVRPMSVSGMPFS